jgi:hypothetical protein
VGSDIEKNNIEKYEQINEVNMLKTYLGEIDRVRVSLTNISINKVRQNAPNMTGKDKISARIIESLLFSLSNRDPISTDAARLVPGIKEIH